MQSLPKWRRVLRIGFSRAWKKVFFFFSQEAIISYWRLSGLSQDFLECSNNEVLAFIYFFIYLIFYLFNFLFIFLFNFLFIFLFNFLFIYFLLIYFFLFIFFFIYLFIFLFIFFFIYLFLFIYFFLFIFFLFIYFFINLLFFLLIYFFNYFFFFWKMKEMPRFNSKRFQWHEFFVLFAAFAWQREFLRDRLLRGKVLRNLLFSMPGWFRSIRQ